MRKVILFAVLALSTAVFAQESEPKFEKFGDLVKATYYNEDGKISVEGFFKDKKLTGEWVGFDNQGNKTKIAYYKDGKKVGKWFVWNNESLKEINYNNNVIVSVNTWKPESKLAINR
jgi:antitoxin component YwqK of YwqJK toxin-antitoxin module